jgi:molybdopterin converting factor small subunit
MLEVRLFAYFRDNRDKVLHLDHKDFTDPQSILDHLEIDLKDVAILLVNGRHTPADVPLKDGDIVAFFPPVAGG